jgi:hypothetical protein
MRFGKVVAALAGALVFAGLMAADASAQRRDRDGDGDRGRDRERRFDPDWVLLGEQRVGFRVDRDVINISHGEDWYRERRFRQLRFVADRNDVHMISIRLVYFNGFAEDFRVDRLIREGSDLPIDLRGERGYIRRIEMVYRSRPDFRGEAVIRVFGEPARRGPPGPPPSSGGDWVELGCKAVSLFRGDRDTVTVGRREGRFKAIRLHARNADVEIRRVTVVYSNGEPDDLPTRHFLRRGGYTPPMDLKGWERRIDRVDMYYKTVPSLRGEATVCVEGLQ